ncbi:hypothetical protein ACHQM5_003527 [Ranunculus cassubicifolius]
MEKFPNFQIQFNLSSILPIAATLLIIIATILYRRRKTRHLHDCYLQTESKPQTSFKHVLADNSYNLFKHFKGDQVSYVHPYEKEITELIGRSELEEFSFCNGEADFDMNMKEGFVWVDKEEGLVELKEVLSKERVFAVDTEQHSARSFLGITALLQISTRSEDYLVDTIALHDVVGILRPVFADPKICKVFHGADNDVVWLQRDFHIYVVNLFDTAKACETLSKPHKSLAYLLENYCGVSTNKMLQREDWRLRPLSEEMIQYARADAHYLLYIAGRMATELKDQNTDCLDDKFNLFLETSRRSNMMCLQLYSKEIEASPGNSAALSIISRHMNGQGASLNSEAKELIERLCMWRDLMARVHDESLRYVLSDQAIAKLASKPPATTADICDTISKAEQNSDSLTVGFIYPSPSPVVCSHLEDIYELLHQKINNLGDIFGTIIQKHLGPNGTCPLSIYNYVLLTKLELKANTGISRKQNGSKTFKRFPKKDSRKLFVQKFSCKSPVYHNCRIYASDGRLLCYCDRKKLEWYISRDLAEIVDDDPPAVMLRFEPKGRPEDEDNNFYVQSKENMCVGCGEKNHYLRYRIIPSCYRKHFPEHLKSHRSHDIVLLCVDCHEKAHAAAEKYKRQVASEFGIPLFVKNIADSKQTETMNGTSESNGNLEEDGVSPSQLRTAAYALLRHGLTMPSDRREELTQTVMKFYGGREISKEDLERALLVGMNPRERRKLEKKRGLPFASNKANENSGHSEEASAPTEEEEEALDCDVVTNGTSETVPAYNQKLSLLGHGPHGERVVNHIIKEYGEDGIREFCQRWRHVFVDSIKARFLPSGWDVMHRGRRDFGDYSVYNPLKKATTD